MVQIGINIDNSTKPLRSDELAFSLIEDCDKIKVIRFNIFLSNIQPNKQLS